MVVSKWSHSASAFVFLFVFAFPYTLRAQVQGVLENPRPASFHSGIGVISGWVCTANRIDIELDGVQFQAGYGTSREDTRAVCNDSNNGFGLLFNWNLLGNGPHSVRALADGQEFATATITVTTLGAEFLTGAGGEFSLADFPQSGQQNVLVWQQSMQNFVIKGEEASSGGNAGGNGRLLENPSPGSFQSGIGVVSGWVCDAQRIDIQFDGQSLQAAYGTSREDTRQVCGDANNGFGLLFNWNLLGDGVHTVRALADGQEFASATIVVKTLGQEFLRGVGKNQRLLNFPQPSTDVIVAWEQSLQNFVIARADTASARITAIDTAGDSITKAFNAQSEAICPNRDQESFNWATSNTHGENFCESGKEGVFSQAERIECRQGADIVIGDPNSAESGAQMLKDFVQQATKITAFLTPQLGLRYVTVWLGHNDVCAGTIEKVRASCPRGDDQDPNNYCRTTPAAFEREFRKGLDILISLPDVKIGVASLVRVSQLCNHEDKESCIFGGVFPSCKMVWETVTIGGPAFGFDHGICGSLTSSCSDRRILDAYEMAKAYHDILAKVTAEYAALVEGEQSHVVTIGGQRVGGVMKARGVRLDFSEAPWVYKFKSNQLSCCDCFHPSFRGQNTAARILFDGFTCSDSDTCCAESDDALANARCKVSDMSGKFYPGLF
ncbi:MAG: SGNH/GDSL hydrolase family protein [Candidatus Binatia bacterium]